MKNAYEEEIVKEACQRLEKVKGIKIEALDVRDADNGYSRIVMEFKMGEYNQILSCEKEVFHDASSAAELPFVSLLVKPELLQTLDERTFITLCFAAWFYKIGKKHRYF